jgi:hypothetical protein
MRSSFPLLSPLDLLSSSPFPYAVFAVLFSIFGFGMTGPFCSSLHVSGTVAVCGIIHSFVLERAILFPVWQMVLVLDVSNTISPTFVEQLTLSATILNFFSF